METLQTNDLKTSHMLPQLSTGLLDILNLKISDLILMVSGFSLAVSEFLILRLVLFLNKAQSDIIQTITVVVALWPVY